MFVRVELLSGGQEVLERENLLALGGLNGLAVATLVPGGLLSDCFVLVGRFGLVGLRVGLLAALQLIHPADRPHFLYTYPLHTYYVYIHVIQ